MDKISKEISKCVCISIKENLKSRLKAGIWTWVEDDETLCVKITRKENEDFYIECKYPKIIDRAAIGEANLVANICNDVTRKYMKYVYDMFLW